MDELLGRRIPYSAEAEQAVIGSMLIDPGCIAEVLEKVKAADFYVQTNRDIFETIFQCFHTARSSIL
jgi:replicative DNA helicase